MAEMRHWEDAEGRYARWVAMWKTAVVACRPAMALTDLSTARFLQLSASAAQMLGTTLEAAVGLSYFDVVDPPSAAEESFRLARDGIIDGTQTRRRLRLPDGSAVEVQTTGWAIRSTVGPDLGLWMARGARSDEHAEVAEEVVAPSFLRQPSVGLGGDGVTIDASWRVTSVRSNAASLLGRPIEETVGASLLALVHPDDVPVLLFALARATTDPGAQAVVRLRHRDGSLLAVQVAPRVSVDAGITVAFALAAPQDSDAPRTRISEAPDHLRRIADQIEAAGVLAPLTEVAGNLGVVETSDLSPRQWEVVSRLAQGERVPTIASEMYLSRSTIRNHLSAIFAKVGVHSQEELVALCRSGGMSRVRSASDEVEAARR